MSKAKQAQASKQSKITADILRKRFIYNPETGEWFKKTRVDHHDGCSGYRILAMYIDGRRCYVKAHRAAFLYMNGKFPENDVDHIDMDKGNNKWENLRDVSTSENLHNIKLRKQNISGCHGVTFRKDMKKWISNIDIDGKRKYLGCFDCLGHAIKARKIALENKFNKSS